MAASLPDPERRRSTGNRDGLAERTIQRRFIGLTLDPPQNSPAQVRLMSFDPMAAAVDWLDAYRARDIDAILDMYADGAFVECRCGGVKTLTGGQAIRAYWEQRLRDEPASDLDSLHPMDGGASISYVTKNGSVSAILEFDADGHISALRCAPSD